MQQTIHPRSASRAVTMVVAITTALMLIGSASAVAATGYDLTGAGGTATINGAVYVALPDGDLEGRGFHPVVRLRGKEASIRGYNTDYRPLQYDEQRSARTTRSLLLSEVPQVLRSGVLHREFLLGISQQGSTTGAYLTLDTLKVYESPFARLCGHPFDGSGGGHTGCTSGNTATLIYDMDAGTDSFVLMDSRTNQGPGRADLRVLMPDSLLNQSPNCHYGGVGCSVFVTLYSAFGADVGGPISELRGNNGGPEAWGVR